MAKINSIDQEKRIFNTIWNSASTYDYYPAFIGRDISGEADFYFNIIIGLCVKYYGQKNMRDLFATREENPKSETYDLLTLLSLEDIVYRREVKQRPVLRDLRYNYAENFFLDKYDPQRRKFALQNPMLFSIQVQKMRDILGIEKKSMTKKEEAIYKKLSYDENISYKDLKESLLRTFTEYLKFDPNKKSRGLSKLIGKNKPLLAFHPLEKSIKPSYLFAETKLSEENIFKSYVYTLLAKHSKKRDKQIEAVFGKSIFSTKEAYKLRFKYCTDCHRRSRLWYSKGVFDKNNLNDAALRAKNTAIEKNKKTFEKNILAYKKQIATLSRSIKSKLNSSVTSFETLADHGSLVGKLAWKSKLPKEDHIFSIKVLRETSSMSVDLLIDGSASLLDFQEDLAIEAYILAKSLEACQIPLRISAYASLDDYTVITILKDFDEKASQDRIFSYYAQGWNRDGLAYRAFEKILDTRPKDNHLMLVMTDCKPRDLKPYMTEGLSFNKSYDGKEALEDTRASLDLIRKKGISLGAIVNTSSKDEKNLTIENARYLFGRNFASIDSAQNFSMAAGRLIKNEIGRLSTLS